MKEQYVGDINDYRKYALLRALSDGGRNRIGLCWMLTPSDGSADGNKLRYLTHPEQHRYFDPPLFDVLQHVTSRVDRRRLLTIEESGLVPGATYFNDELNDSLSDRHAFMARCLSKFDDVDLAFFDPDNGMETKLKKGRTNSNKYIYLDELEAFYMDGKSLLVYQHFPRVERRLFLSSCVQRLSQFAGIAPVWAFTTAHVVFLLVLHPHAHPTLRDAPENLSCRWEPGFIRIELLEPRAVSPIIDSPIPA